MLIIFNINLVLATSLWLAMATSHAQQFDFNYVLVCEESYGTVFETHGSVPSIIACASVCSNNANCMSSVYNLGTESCELNSEPWDNYSTTGCLLDVFYIERLSVPQQMSGLPMCLNQNSCTVPYANMRLCEGGGPGVCDPSQGRIEVHHEGKWWTVCDDNWDEGDDYFYTNANVACRALNYTSGSSLAEAFFGYGSGNILLDDVQCEGNEASLYDCPANNWGNHDCDHSEDVGVSCQ